ncbi:SixA phosphatase family protein [Segetibacter aerophilus]|uniref:Phosphohistidine phosphatase SixA n=1 Tax=Segetibacter aerophilus TaxID=670293 RepID=A0A512BCF1_9BACT|nr:phosphoglycerate mutase family protein [Segetibacter aerophilus]GEO09641.1 phosphohistidine phosphatase SixA [Segetibacter aerophilus]
MKSILLVRHAKSSWDFNVEDFDRPLNQRGETDAAAMAKRLLKKDVKIDAFVSSPAKRALTTATYFAEAYDKKQKHIIIVPALYEAGVSDFFNTIAGLDNDLKHVALFSHNPGITTFASKLTATFIDDMPTCAVFAVKADLKKWSDFEGAQKEFWFFDYPKAG